MVHADKSRVGIREFAVNRIHFAAQLVGLSVIDTWVLQVFPQNIDQHRLTTFVEMQERIDAIDGEKLARMRKRAHDVQYMGPRGI